MQVKTFYRSLIITISFFIIYLLFKFIFPLIFPFLISGVFALLFYPYLKKYAKHLHISPTILGVAFILLFFFLSSIAFFFLGKTIFKELKSLTGNLSYYQNTIHCCLTSACVSLENITGIQASCFETSLLSCFENLLGSIQTNMGSKIFMHSFSYVKFALSLITILFLIFVSFILWLKDYEIIKKLLTKCSLYGFFHKFYLDTKTFISTYLKAQLIILSVICLLSVIGLLVLKNPYALLLGILIGLLDAMPFLGTGCVFIPCGIFHLIQADFYYSAVYLTLYLVTALSREFLEPRLIGSKFGIPSILILIAIYAGIQMFGISGVILGPIYFLFCYEIINYFHDNSFFLSGIKGT